MVGLPWKVDGPNPDVNFGPSMGRLKTTLNKIRRTPELLEQYNQIMVDQVNAGILEPAPYVDHSDPPDKLYYMPHQPVVKETSSTTKLRIVYDCSSGDPSLNDCLYRGRVYAGQDEKAVYTFLARTRLFPSLLVSDLEKAFLQIRLHDGDKDSNRLLWPENPEISDRPQVLRFTRVTFGIISSPYLLGATVEFHLSQTKSGLADSLIKGAYVDNFITPIFDPAEILAKAQEIRKIFWTGGFNCRQFTSNCRAEVKELPEDWREDKEEVSLLGVPWKVDEDVYVMRFPVHQGKFTKRTLLSTLASMFDPNGFCAPALLPAKHVQASVWKEGYGWDEELPKSFKVDWDKATEGWEANEIWLPRRCFMLENGAPIQLHAFADASGSGLGYSIYARHPETYQTGLLFARAVVIPTSMQPKPTKKDPNASRGISIPRLEIQALYLLARTVNRLKETLEIKISEVLLWTDSTTSIQWLQKEHHGETFVRNRIKVLKPFQVRYINTSENPADLASRGCRVQELKDHQLWFHGPEWLQQPEEK